MFSAVFHIGFFLFILHAKYTYKIFTLAEHVTSAVIVPKEFLPFPGRSGVARSEPGAKEPVVVKPGRPETGQAAPARGKPDQGETGGQPGSGRAGVQSQAAGGTPRAAEAAAPGGPASGFQLVYPKGGQLSLAKPAENPVEQLLRPNRYKATDLKIGKVLRPDAARPGSGGGGGYGGPVGQGGGSGGGRIPGSGLPENIVRYDFTPWANEVTAMIQKYWSVAQTGNTAWRGEVGIMVLVKKTGELLGADITKSSNIDVLDQAALRALEKCAPFPPLPADFPASSLEMYLVFQYGR